MEPSSSNSRPPGSSNEANNDPNTRKRHRRPRPKRDPASHDGPTHLDGQNPAEGSRPSGLSNSNRGRWQKNRQPKPQQGNSSLQASQTPGAIPAPDPSQANTRRARFNASLTKTDAEHTQSRQTRRPPRVGCQVREGGPGRVCSARPAWESRRMALSWLSKAAAGCSKGILVFLWFYKFSAINPPRNAPFLRESMLSSPPSSEY